tara:strand:+ start:838 stop:1062 length:225 start_codon:yes stop_codon:yes gene_type:complete
LARYEFAMIMSMVEQMLRAQPSTTVKYLKKINEAHQLSDILKNLTSNHHPLDLTGTFTNGTELCIAVVTFNGKL